MAQQTINTGFVPRKFQIELRAKMRRFNVIVAHRRFGKTVFCANHQIDKLLRNKLPAPRNAYIAPTFGQAKRVVWDYYKKYSKDIPGVEPHEQDLRIDFTTNQGRQMLLSGENYASIKGIYLDDVVLDEFAEMDPSVWTEAVRPTLSDRAGCATFIGTPRGKNMFHKLYEYATQSGDPEWFGCVFKASQTGIILPEELESARRTMTEDEYDQEYECNFNAGLMGAYFARELAKAESEGRIGDFPYDPGLAVDTYWDLGIDDMCSVWFVQSSRGRHRCIDYYEVCGSSIPEVVAEIKRKPYALGNWVFPHDANARDFSTGKAQIQIFYNLGCRPSRIIPRVGTKREGIDAARRILPLVEFDRKNCKRGLECLSNYQRKWNSKNNVFEESPLHNWACFTEDTLVLTRYGKRPIGKLPQSGEVLTPCGWKAYTNPRLTLQNAPLVRVTFKDGTTVRCTPEHLFLTDSGWKSAEHLERGSLIQSSLMPTRNTLMGKCTELFHTAPISRLRNFFIDPFGKMPLGTYQTGAIFTTGMRTTPITGSSIWNVSPSLNTSPSTKRENRRGIFQTSVGGGQPNGMHPKQEDSGTSVTLNAQRVGRNGSAWTWFVATAKKYLAGYPGKVGTLKNGAPIVAGWVPIKSVQRLKETANVWDLTVPDGHWFCLENGAVVHNSNGADAFQQFALGQRGDSGNTREMDERPAYGITGTHAVANYNPFGGRR